MSKLIRVLAVFVVLALLVPPSSSIAGSKPNQPLQNAAASMFHTLQAPPVPSESESTTTSPPYYLSDTSVADAPIGSTTLELDGKLSPGEYAHAHRLTFPTYGGDAEAFIVQNAFTLTIGIDSPDTTPFGFGSGGHGPALQVFLDTQHDRATIPQTDDYMLTIKKDGTTSGVRGNGYGWYFLIPPTAWKAAKQVTSWGWQAEFSIGFNTLGITSTVAVTRTIGLALAEVWTPSHTPSNPKDWYWPTSADYFNPSTWGNLISSSWWSTTYWKPSPWEDYAPSGMPDFDQNQNNWFSDILQIPSHCGPVAVANSLWWLDSKFETPDHSPDTTISDTYPLVQSYGAMDDHDPNNVIPLVDDLANNYFETNNGIAGTDILKMNAGLQQYLRDKGLWDDYSVTLVKKPSFTWVADEVQRSQGIILLLGFWQLVDPQNLNYFQRISGHYVTVAGVNQQQQLVSFSDPMLDNAEADPAAGYVYTGTLITHSPIPGHPFNIHNDAGNVSHDVYPVVSVPPTWNTAGTWMLPKYPALANPLFTQGDANPHPDYPNQKYIPGAEHPVFAVVEFALALSPYNWKASGWKDYAPNGLPDIGQKQANWEYKAQQWSYCGPVAAANSLWWFDSKFEPSPVAPPAYNDHYRLIKSYDTEVPPWDDHVPQNVDNPTIGSQFVDDLALKMKTDVSGPGTVITDVRTGIVDYLKAQKLDSVYTVNQIQAPDFWWVADEVERSEDVILLLGFWEGDTIGQYHRVGGHYVTIAGVDKKGGEIAFSDPWFDRIEQSWPYAGTPAPDAGVPTCDPCYMGRVADGKLITPHPKPHPGGIIETIHNDTGNVSHDIYYVVSTTSPGGNWGPLAYANSWSEIENFWYENGDGSTPSGGPIQTEVEWAIAVSPFTSLFLPVVMR